MKYSIHETQEQAQEVVNSIEAHLGIPNEYAGVYAIPEEVDGQWRFRVKDTGPWKCDDVAVNVVEIED